MNNIVSYMEFRGRAGRGRASRIDPLMLEILEALHFAGGAAHRQSVADYIAQVRAGRPLVAKRDLQDQIFGALKAHMEAQGRRKTSPLVFQPLGEHSYRWALTERGHALFDRSAEYRSASR